MRKIIQQLFAVLFFTGLFSGALHAGCASPAHCRGMDKNGAINENFFMPCQKKYVSLNDVTINEKGIFISLNGQKLQTSALFSDESGLYFENFMHEQDCFAGLDVTCKGCGVCNASWQVHCRHCDKDLTQANATAMKQ